MNSPNPQWNTPPDGDFARYVEQLSARSAIARRTSEADGEHALDAGMAPTDGPHGATGRARQVAPLPAGERMGRGGGRGAASVGARPASVDLLRGAALVWIGIMVALSLANVPFGLVALVFVGGLWLAHQFRRRILPPGISTWRAWLEDMARQAAQKQQRQGK